MITSIIIFAMTFYFGLLVLLYVLQDRLVFPAPDGADTVYRVPVAGFGLLNVLYLLSHLFD